MNKVIDNYVLKQIIGQGQYGKVFKAFNTQTYSLYAVKVIKSDKFKEVPKLQEFTMNQIRVLSKLEHPNIVKFIQMLKTSNNMYLVYEYCEHGTLEELIQRKKYLSEKETIDIMKQILSAFRLLAQHNILHRDIKPSNILFNNGVIKIADFGFCKSLEPNEMANTMVGSPIYMAPQILKGSSYTTKADIWSLGIVIYECLFGYCPYEDKSIGRLIKLIDNKDLNFPQVPKISKQLVDVIRRMITINTSKRIDWLGLLDHDLFKEANTQKLYIQKLENPEYFKSVESPRYTSRSQTEDKNIVENFLRFLIKERKKMHYLNVVIKSVNQYRFTENYLRIAQLLLSKVNYLFTRLFKTIRNIDSDHQYTQSQKNQIKNSKELAKFVEIINPQKQLVEQCIKLYKGSLHESQLECSSRLYSEQILAYVKEIREEKDEVSSEAVKIKYVHCNEILDCVLLIELFQNYISLEKQFSDQKYFIQIKKMTKQNLGKIIDHKTRYIQKKYFL